jgi:hypothetical protein
MAGLDVNDAQAAHCQADISVNKEAFVVRATVDNLPVHVGQGVALDLSAAIQIEDSADSTHI